MRFYEFNFFEAMFKALCKLLDVIFLAALVSENLLFLLWAVLTKAACSCRT